MPDLVNTDQPLNTGICEYERSTLVWNEAIERNRSSCDG